MSHARQLCRACLSTKESFSYIMFGNVSPDVYYFCTSVEIYLEDELPKALCDTCYELVTRFAEFKQTCIQSQNTLLGLNTCEKIETRNKDLSELEDGFKIEDVDVSVKIEQETEDNGVLDSDEFPPDEVINTVMLCKRKTKKLEKLKCHSGKKIKSKVQRKKFIYTCDVCHRKFNYLTRFEAHKLEHEGKTVSINCVPCNKTFATWSGLKRHNENEHTLVSLESLKCKVCGKISKSRQTLRMHVKMHGQRRLSVCDVCGKGFTTAVILKAHLETHKENRERRFTCEHCGKKFFTNSILLSHTSRRHTGRRYICQICNYPFTDKYNLAKHLLIHDGKKLHKCDICHKSYGALSTLKEHKRIHSGERPYICSHCPKGFISKKRLTDHIRVHTGDKPYKCTVCDQRFTQGGTLKRHMKVHDRIIPTIT